MSAAPTPPLPIKTIASHVAVPFVIGHHVHRAVAPVPPPEADPTGIDYLGILAAAHDEQAGAGAAIDFTRLPGAQDREDGDG